MALVTISCDSDNLAFVPNIQFINGVSVVVYVPACSGVNGSTGWVTHETSFSLSLEESNQLLQSGLLVIAVAWLFSLIRKQLGK